MEPVSHQYRLPEALQSVRAKLTFMLKSDQKPYIETEALTGDREPHYHAEMEEREVEIHDGRPLAGKLALERNGFLLRRHQTQVREFYDNDAVVRRYYPEVEALLNEITGASRVVVFDHTRRTDADTRQGIRGPARRVHNDYTEKSAPERVRDVLGEEQAAALADVPFAQINVWRPIRGPVQRSPITLLDAVSLSPEDLVSTDMIYPGRIGEIYHLAFNPEQRWFYFPEMARDEVLLIKGYDSRRDGRARFTPHTAFADPTTPVDAPPRESIEVRALAFFEER
jgi:hypothetical protein